MAKETKRGGPRILIIKRDGTEAIFNKQKICTAVRKANKEVKPVFRMNKDQILDVGNHVEELCSGLTRAIHVEEIQDMVERSIMHHRAYEVAQVYIRYRYEHELKRKANTTDEAILSLIDLTNEEIKQENSNKNPTVVSVQRDYMAGEVSKDLCERFLVPERVWNTHKSGRGHFHDSDYFAQKMHNCDLINLEDMLQNGTCISGTMIEKPHSLLTACNITTQIIAQVASSQYGGQSISLSHLAPFVDMSRQKIRANLMKRHERLYGGYDEDEIEYLTEEAVLDEIRAGIQTIQYQVLTLQTTNGQAPFITVFMYLNEIPDEEVQLKHDLALMIEEMLKQRIKGVKNKNGKWVAPAFPKLIYVTSENNITKGQPYYYLTELAVKCSIKRMVPDYVSEKKMLELKGAVYPPMGCVDGKEVITYRFNNTTYTESFERMWDKMSDYFTIKHQPNGKDFYIDTDGIEIYDSEVGFVKNYRLIKNFSEKWMTVKLSNGRSLNCTDDHPFETENRGIVLAKNLLNDDKILIDKRSDGCTGTINFNKDRAWLMGMVLCDSSYADNVTISIALESENDIEEAIKDIAIKEYGIQAKTIVQERGNKGSYKDVRLIATEDKLPKLVNFYSKSFGGKTKEHRHIPTDVFNWNRESKLSFLAGMIDADGYVNNKNSITIIQIGSTNKELAIQQMLLAQSVGYRANLYLNHYNSNYKDKIRYRVEFVPDEDLIDYLKCNKKKSLFNVENTIRTNDSKSLSDIATVIDVITENEKKYSYDVTTESEHFTVSGIYSHNCRSFLTPDRFTSTGVKNIANAKNYIPGKQRYYGRFNQGVYTINLVYEALSSDGDMNKFWNNLAEGLDIAHEALQCRHNRLKGTISDVAPILWQDGALARLKPGETIDKLLYDGYSTISLGYAGLYECTKYMTGYSHTDKEGKEFALKVMQTLNDACSKWKAEENIDYSVYGTPLESTVYKFSKALQEKFGIIKDITDHNYITNSYHVNVRENIDAFTKLKFESEFQNLSPGGAISYVEIPNMKNNPEAVMKIVQYMYENIMYAELNTKIDYCMSCNYEGELEIIKTDAGKLIWKCPNCGCVDQDKLNPVRRTCGYIGSQKWNQGRTEEIKDRVLHVGINTCDCGCDS